MHFSHNKRGTIRRDLENSVRLTLFGRSLLLIVAEVLANAICWIVAGILFGGHGQTQSVLSLALLAWVCAIRTL
jgi:high-affinity nickel-transport protein